MGPLFCRHELQGILERGLLTGKWSTLQFNKEGLNMVLPSSGFLTKYLSFKL